MDAFALSVAVAAAVFLCGVLGLHLHRFLPEQHLSKETQDVIRLGTGMLSVLASLVLGLLISTVKTSYDENKTALRAYSADLIVLDGALLDYGAGASTARNLLRDYTSRLLIDTWSDQSQHPFLEENREAGEILERLREAIRSLEPTNHDQQLLAAQAHQSATALQRERWLLIERAGATVQPIVFVIVVCWICVIFLSFGMNAPQHTTIYMVFLTLSFAIGSAVFLIMELDSPFEGVVRISSQSVQTALDHMQRPAP